MHPNLIPVNITVPKDLARLIHEMKEVARNEPDEEYEEGSATVEEADERSKRQLPGIIQSGHRRIGYEPPRRLIAIVLTLDTYTNPPRWDLSLSHPVTSTRVRNALASVLAWAFLGEGYKEIPSDVAYKHVRRFVKDAPEEVR